MSGSLLHMTPSGFDADSPSAFSSAGVCAQPSAKTIHDAASNLIVFIDSLGTVFCNISKKRKQPRIFS
jgi:hypothetical protein